MEDNASVNIPAAVRDPLACGLAVAERFTGIRPQPQTYMHSFGLLGILDRRHVEAVHRWQPAVGGWRQILNDYDSSPCAAAMGLMTYGCARALLNGWVPPEYCAVANGGLRHLGDTITAQGALGRSSLPTGGLDTLEVYADHFAVDDEATLGFVLSGCAYGALFQASRDESSMSDRELGAR